MASWFEKGRPGLLDALTAVCDQIDIDLRAELQDRNRMHEETKSELETLRCRVAELEKVESENRTLREQLSQLQKNDIEPDQAAVAACIAPALATLPNEDVWNNLLRKSHVLQRKYDKLNSNYKSLRAAYNEKKETLELFQRCTQCLQEASRSAKRPHDQHPGPGPADDAYTDDPRPVHPSKRRSRASSETYLGDPARDGTAHLSFSSDPGPCSHPEGEVPTSVPRIPESPAGRGFGPAVTPAIRKEDAGNNDDMESTEDDATDAADDDDVGLPPLPGAAADVPSAIAIKPEPSSDGLVIVDERSVRKRRAPDHTNQPPPRKIKIEASSSDSDLGFKQIGLVPHDSIDLDETGQVLNTPRKNRLLDDALANVHESAPLRLWPAAKVLIRPDLTNQPGTRPIVASSVLAPISSNIRNLESSTRKPASKPLKKGLDEGIESLAEDGGPYRQRPIRGPSIQSPAENSRLDKLLNTPATREGPTSVRSAPPTRSISRSLLPGLGPPQRRKLPFGEDKRGRSKDSSPSRAEKGSEVGGLETAPERKPLRPANEQAERSRPGALRSKSPSRLRLDDFKINPKYNSGFDYAFSEVVRGKDDRACLPGCVDMNCCGKKFRALAKAQRSNTEKNTSEDMKLFEEYLGDSISRVLGMSPAEKEELWLEAKTWKLANQLGKHRHHYSRRPTPPGFWDPEFPDTQAIAAEKAEAEKRGKQVIQERYREAMRPGGRWVFKDE
ncbi:SAE2-domain-containing protein [Sodiomyces alkalinus F11]|uniref:SAE2-domain-containing protein n=1 Tax=Sodiomyces alkalinus (strain CBS 110278 / VKM F-3762 / F11) TaxID=1314773 RepID=A0A3N2Q3Z7_SODAK|nr:SAE2-domain-containing protein [Sodiomyces alkalinus F11]ROT41483.1 SAE2-domain-containing protein [Sodiomyces alkalinus F11]